MTRSRQPVGHRGSRAAVVAALVLVAACAPPTPSPIATTPSPTVPGPTATASAVPSIVPGAANPAGCPGPSEPLSAVDYASTAEWCFPAGVTVDGWFHRDAEGAIQIGTRVGSVGEQSGFSREITVTLASGQTLPADVGYGRFVSSLGSNTQSTLEATAVTILPNPASSCPAAQPIPAQVFFDSLTECYRLGADVTIAGWRDTLDGICGCESLQWIETPTWLTSEYGFGWLFAQPWQIEHWVYIALHAPKMAALGHDSGARPTYMEVTGHFGDAAAATCRAQARPGGPFPDGPPSSSDVKAETARLKAECADRFVVTHLREVAAPAAALWFCPAGPPYNVANVVAGRDRGPGEVHRALMESLCFGGRDVTIRGWFDPRPAGLDFEPSTMPAWLGAAGRPALWQSADAPRDPSRALLLFVDPANGVSLPTAAGWYAMTGHFDDPAAATCVRTDGDNAGLDWSDECREEFVVTGVGR